MAEDIEEEAAAVAKRIEEGVFYPRGDMVCTETFSRFLTEYQANLNQFLFVITVVTKADETRVRAAQALVKAELNEEKRKKYEETIAKPDLVLDQLKKHAKVTSENLTNGAVNAFQRYFSGIFQSAANKRPEIMISTQQIRVEDIFRFTKHRDLVGFIIDRKVNDLSYGGIYEMEKYFDDRLGVKMFNDDNERALLKLFIEARNINIHNGGVVNDIFLSRVGKVAGFKYTKGKVFHVDFESLITLSENAMKVAMQIDREVAAKFRLRTKRHTAWCKGRTKRKQPRSVTASA